MVTSRWVKNGQVLALVSAVSLGVLAEPALAAVAVSRAEADGTRLRLEGTALPSRGITVDGVAMGNSDGAGAFRLERDPYVSPADCTVDVGDGSATVTVARLAGCTVVSGPGDSTAPTAPTGLTASLSGTTASLSWAASSDAVGVTGYRITRNGTVLAGTISGTTFTQSGLAAGTYTYTVSAVDAAGNVSTASNSASVTVASPPPTTADTTAPSAPVLSVVLSGTTAFLSWPASTDAVGVVGYLVSRTGAFPVDTPDTSYSSTGLAPGSHTFSVAARDQAGNVSASSNEVTVTVPPSQDADTTAPSVPANVATFLFNTNITVSWSSSTDDTGLAGYRLTRNGVARATISPIDLSFTDSGLPAGTYTYTVVAFDAAGNSSGPSASASATVAAPSTALVLLTASQLPDAVRGEAYLAYVVGDAGVKPYRFKVVSGALPSGLRLDQPTLPSRADARITGTPTATGTSTFTIQLSDDAGTKVRRVFTLAVRAAAQI